MPKNGPNLIIPPKWKRLEAPVSANSLAFDARAPYGELRKTGGRKRAVGGGNPRVHVLSVLSMFFRI
jgi:hypothetical protein